MVDVADVEAGRVPVLAPEGFLEHAVSENVYAGTAMARRASYMYGALLDKGPSGQVTAGLGLTTSTGSITLIPPTRDIARTGEELTLDGVRMIFQLTPGTEAPAEMNFLFPEQRALCIAENATHNLHNILTPRGALVRDPRVWAALPRRDDPALRRPRRRGVRPAPLAALGSRSGSLDFLAKQRDLYAYLHDQTLRLLNKGHTGKEIAELIELPPSLEREWHCRGYYGSVSHNVKAIYQRYMGWFDGNPAHLWEHPPVEAAKRYVDFMGGADAVLEKARAAFEAGDLRWVAEVVNHVVFAEPDNAAARELQAQALEQLGYGAENADLAQLLPDGREGAARGRRRAPRSRLPPADIVASLSCEQLFDSMAIRLDGPKRLRRPS